VFFTESLVFTELIKHKINTDGKCKYKPEFIVLLNEIFREWHGKRLCLCCLYMFLFVATTNWCKYN
jgi:hypothetical protein